MEKLLGDGIGGVVDELSLADSLGVVGGNIALAFVDGSVTTVADADMLSAGGIFSPMR